MGIINHPKVDFKYSNNNSNIRTNNSYRSKNMNIQNVNQKTNYESITFDSSSQYTNLSSKVKLPYSDWIFGPEAAANHQFGGNQHSINDNAAKYIQDPKVKEIISKYYPEATAEDLELLFYRMMRIGCGFIAAINTFLFESGYYQGKHSADEFLSTFGFPLIGENGFANYDYMFLDFFLYYAKYHEGYSKIEDVYGNAEEEKERGNSGDSALNKDGFVQTGIDGSDLDDVAECFRDYLASKGKKVKVYPNGFIMSPEDTAKWREEEGIHPGEAAPNRAPYPIEKQIERVLKDLNLIMTIDSGGFPLYLPYDADGNGKLDDIAKGCESIGAHAMTVVGLADEPGKVIVSSWGEEYVMNISDIQDFCVYDYSEYNGVESSVREDEVNL